MNQARFYVAITVAFALLITSVGASDLGPQGVSPGTPDRIAACRNFVESLLSLGILRNLEGVIDGSDLSS